MPSAWRPPCSATSTSAAIILSGSPSTPALAAPPAARAAEARALTSLGIVDSVQGRCEQATGQFQQALALYRDSGDEFGEARVLSNLGVVCRRQGRYQEAADYYRQARALFCETGHRLGEARALGNLGIVDERLGRYPQAIGHHQHAAALGLASQIGDQYEQARAHNGLARSYHATGDQSQARRHWQEALTRYTDLGAAGSSRAGLRPPRRSPRRPGRRAGCHPASMSGYSPPDAARSPQPSPLPVPAAPVAGEALASFTGRLAAANRTTPEALLDILPPWFRIKARWHDDRWQPGQLMPRADDAAARLALISGTTAPAVRNALPAFGTRVGQPARAATACRRCTTEQLIHATG